VLTKIVRREALTHRLLRAMGQGLVASPRFNEIIRGALPVALYQTCADDAPR